MQEPNSSYQASDSVVCTVHTPGPWIWGDDFCGLYGAGPDNEVLNHASYEGMWLGYNKHREANARLIAAAPDLLAALQALLNDECQNRQYVNGHPAAQAARAALALATKEQA
jgi:hypothetical protein